MATDRTRTEADERYAEAAAGLKRLLTGCTVRETRTTVREYADGRPPVRQTVTRVRELPPDLKAIVFVLTGRMPRRWGTGGPKPSGEGGSRRASERPDSGTPFPQGQRSAPKKDSAGTERPAPKTNNGFPASDTPEEEWPDLSVWSDEALRLLAGDSGFPGFSAAPGNCADACDNSLAPSAKDNPTAPRPPVSLTSPASFRGFAEAVGISSHRFPKAAPAPDEPADFPTDGSPEPVGISSHRFPKAAPATGESAGFPTDGSSEPRQTADDAYPTAACTCAPAADPVIPNNPAFQNTAPDEPAPQNATPGLPKDSASRESRPVMPLPSETDHPTLSGSGLPATFPFPDHPSRHPEEQRSCDVRISSHRFPKAASAPGEVAPHAPASPSSPEPAPVSTPAKSYLFSAQEIRPASGRPATFPFPDHPFRHPEEQRSCDVRISSYRFPKAASAPGEPAPQAPTGDLPTDSAPRNSHPDTLDRETDYPASLPSSAPEPGLTSGSVPHRERGPDARARLDGRSLFRFARQPPHALFFHTPISCRP